MQNILDKTDKSLSPVPRGNDVSKRVKFKWSSGGPPGEFREISKYDLFIDGDYQRDCVSHAKILEIAREWDWLLFGTLSLVERPERIMAVFDGGHRTRASFYRDDIDLLPCLVHKFDDVSAEAKAYVARNTMVSAVSSTDRHRASICAQEPLALRTQAILDGLGLTVNRTARQNTVRCINTIKRAVSHDEELAQRCLRMCMLLADEEGINAQVFSGLFCLCERKSGQMDVLKRHGDRLLRHNQRELTIKIRQRRSEEGKGGQLVAARALLGVINHGLHNKVPW